MIKSDTITISPHEIKKEYKMAEDEDNKKKSLFDRAIDALTDRDEKEAEAKAAAEKAAAEKAAATKAAAEKAAAERGAALRATVEKAAAAATAPKKGVVTVRSLRIRADHNTTSEVVGGLVDGNEVTILSTWSDGKDTWAQLDKGWAAMVYDGEIYIKLA
jgi:membrane protein involved in colicin uptake